ncbi:NUDIX hydrolase [Actinopolymorpha singaporensis]|uniref:8-oxo-dGTP diphosphatase n=1 Tax=Actinopolymorpha singaporensis TaxID=117157 RepID=A0A1H1LXA8_9ACTN|nr:NUDIX hydrolase [Actinopolymorpha singaporensis]SDR79151.1 8-oxo-dGTP diphosphatase [Actinopolymorpha singaporensis]
MVRGKTEPRDRVVEAAGAVVWRPSPYERAEVLLVHRPKYDDWSFPKGKLEPGERAPAAAVREVAEETGIRVVLGPPMPPVRYPLAGGAVKVVRYWQAVPVDDGADFTPGHEVDRRAWLRFAEAARRLTHPRDRSLLTTLTPRSTRPLVLVRHGSALPRSGWTGDDLERPLGDEGHTQAAELVGALAAYGITRVVSSPARRCVETLLPYATSAGVRIEPEPAFAEGADPALVAEQAMRLLDAPEPTAVCTHRPTLPDLWAGLGVTPLPLQPGEAVVLHLAGRTPVAVERHPPAEALSGR